MHIVVFLLTDWNNYKYIQIKSWLALQGIADMQLPYVNKKVNVFNSIIPKYCLE